MTTTVGSIPISGAPAWNSLGDGWLRYSQTMDIAKMLAELRQERDGIDEAIAVLARGCHQQKGAIHLIPFNAHFRHYLTAHPTPLARYDQ
jgi:hypothetical protein